GSVNVGSGPQFWAAPFELNGEFGGLGFPPTVPPAALIPHAKGRPGENTTIAIVATDATLTKAQAKELAVIAQDGLARAIYPAHTTLDGDTVFAAATGRRPLADAVNEITELGAIAANVLARSVARAIFAAKALPGGLASWPTASNSPLRSAGKLRSFVMPRQSQCARSRTRCRNRHHRRAAIRVRALQGPRFPARWGGGAYIRRRPLAKEYAGGSGCPRVPL